MGAVFTVAFAASVVLAVVGTGRGLMRGIVAKAEEALPPDVLTVKPKSANVLMFNVSAPGLDRRTVDRIRALPGVGFVAPQMALKMPLRANGTVMGQTAETDCFVVGVEGAAVADSINSGMSFDDPADTRPDDNHETAPIPVVIPRIFLDMYNQAYAESVGLPKINEDFMKGKHFTLVLGGSVLLGEAGNPTRKARWLKCRIVGMTSNPSYMRAGLMIPLSRAESLNAWWSGAPADRYSSAFVKVRDTQEADAVARSIRRMDLVVESQNEFLGKIRFASRAATAMGAVFAAIVVAIGAVGILNTFALIMAERREEVLLLRAVGATRRRVMALYGSEAAVIGLAGGTLAAAVCGTALWLVDRRIASATADWAAYIPRQVFAVTPAMLGAVVAGAVVAGLMAAGPAILRVTTRGGGEGA